MMALLGGQASAVQNGQVDMQVDVTSTSGFGLTRQEIGVSMVKAEHIAAEGIPSQ